MALFWVTLIWALSVLIYYLLVRRYGGRLWIFIVLTAMMLTPALGHYKAIAPPFAIYPLWTVLHQYVHPLGIEAILLFVMPAASVTVLIATLVRRWLRGSWT